MAGLTKTEKDKRKNLLMKGFKNCSKCGESKQLEEFNKAKSHNDGLDNKCRKCSKFYDEGRDKTPLRKDNKFRNNRKSALMKKYNLTLEEYDKMSENQNHCCKICNLECKSGRHLAVDHCHELGTIRGLLCMNCNVGLGKFQEDSNLLLKAFKYLNNLEKL